MKRRHHAVAWVLLAVAAFVLWPQRWGGAMTYVITSGTSMQPAFVAGDLAVLRTAGDYRVGDIAAYQSAGLKRIVMHRITKETPAGYTLKGDNNDFLDPETVTEQQMLGKLVVRVPKVGLAVGILLKPVNLILLLGALFLFFTDRKERKEQLSPAVAPAPGAAPTPPAAAAPLILRITALRLPQDLPTADLADPDDLERLAQLHGIAILRDADADYLLQGGMLFRCPRAEVQRGRHEAPAVELPQGLRRPNPHGRDWDYYQDDPDVIDLDSRRRA